jgi:hypothetical protein
MLPLQGAYFNYSHFMAMAAIRHTYILMAKSVSIIAIRHRMAAISKKYSHSLFKSNNQ